MSESGPEPAGRFALSSPAAGALLGLLVGIADWIVLITDWGQSQSGMWHLPAFSWIAVIWTSMTAGALTGLLFSSARLGRARPVLLTFAGPGMFLLIRAARPLRESFGLTTIALLLTCLGVTLLLSVAMAFLPLRNTRSRWGWAIGTAGSVIVLIVLAVQPDLRTWSGGGAGSGEAAAHAGVRKNVVLIFLDTVAYQDALGKGASMPRLAAFARDSTSFANAWAPAPWTVPSHLAVLGGIDPWHVPDDAAPMLAERFRAHGYATAAIAANPLLGTPGFFRGYETFRWSRASGVCRSAIGELLNRMWVHGGPRSPLCGWLVAPQVTARALDFVESVRRPYFLTLNYMDAHYPYYVPPACREPGLALLTRAERLTFRRASPSSPASAGVLARGRRQYHAAMSCMDRSLGVLLDALQGDPNTIVAIAGDHGEQFGEHGLVEHGNSLYRQVLHVPLIVRLPGTRAVIVNDAVSITDVHASLARAAGIARGGMALPLLDARLRRPVLATYTLNLGARVEGGFSSVIGNDHYIRWRDGREVLFDLAADPMERSPLSTSGAAAARAVPLRSLTRGAETRRRATDFRALGYLQ